MNFVRLLALVIALALWYVVLPASAFTDIGFLGLLAAVLLGKYFHRVYVPSYPGLEVPMLGHLALIRTAALVLLLVRKLEPAGFGFWPRRNEWKEGFAHYLYFLPLGFPLGLATDAIRFGPLPSAWRLIGTFFGILWVVALSEEFFFRGALQRWLERWTGSSAAALVGVALLFGSVHLPFRGFPNWRFAAMAAVAGLFYGLAFRRTGSIRASMVTHALVVTTWRALFV
jgi:membrane protease YdiL (CAAX protease family)